MKKGFTLIEILVVVAIIGILASIVLVGLGGFRERARDSRRIADLRQVQNVLELYANKCGRYPTQGAVSPDGCSGITGAGGDLAWTDLATLLKGAGLGIATIPNDPLAPAKNYFFKYSSDHQHYVIGANLDGDNPLLDDEAEGDSTNIPAAWGVPSPTDCDDANLGYCILF